MVNIAGLDGKAMFNALEENGVTTDWREPNVIRVAQCLYTIVSKMFIILSEYCRSAFNVVNHGCSTVLKLKQIQKLMREKTLPLLVLAQLAPCWPLFSASRPPVKLYESRPDSRIKSIYQGKSINIALSDRGWLALETIGLDKAVKQQAIAMQKRVMHAVDGTITEQAYGTESQAIWSVSRAGINEQLLDLAEQEPLVEVKFNQRLVDVDFNNASASFMHEQNVEKVAADLLFGADGAYSKVRRLAQETPRFSYNQSYMPQSYIELHIPANDDGSFKMANNALHIWPRNNLC